VSKIIENSRRCCFDAFYRRLNQWSTAPENLKKWGEQEIQGGIPPQMVFSP